MKLRNQVGALLLVILTSLVISAAAFAKKGDQPGGGDGTDAGHVSMDVTGVVIASQDCDEKLSVNDTSYLCNKSGANHAIFLTDDFMGHVGTAAINCFGSGVFPVTIGVELHRDNSAETVLRFWAFKVDGETEVLYVLRVSDPSGWSGPFPPAVADTTTMGGSGISWDLGVSNKKQQRGACVDSGTDFIEVSFSRDS